jgi:nitroreductase
MYFPMPAAQSLSLHPLLEQRFSPRGFADIPVESEKIELLFEAARIAPSSFNEQPWRFVYATKENRHLYNKLLDCLTEKNQDWAKTAPLLILSIAKLTYTRNGNPNRHALHDAGLAMGNILVQATSMDLFVHQMGGFSIAKARENFELSADYEPVTMAAVGYLPEENRHANHTRSRKPLEELILNGPYS